LRRAQAHSPNFLARGSLKARRKRAASVARQPSRRGDAMTWPAHATPDCPWRTVASHREAAHLEFAHRLLVDETAPMRPRTPWCTALATWLWYLRLVAIDQSACPTTTPCQSRGHPAAALVIVHTSSRFSAQVRLIVLRAGTPHDRGRDRRSQCEIRPSPPPCLGITLLDELATKMRRCARNRPASRRICEPGSRKKAGSSNVMKRPTRGARASRHRALSFCPITQLCCAT
jgi:hypothetical protein